MAEFIGVFRKAPGDRASFVADEAVVPAGSGVQDLAILDFVEVPQRDQPLFLAGQFHEHPFPDLLRGAPRPPHAHLVHLPEEFLVIPAPLHVPPVRTPEEVVPGLVPGEG